MFRSGDFKLIHGFPGPFPGWYKPDQYENLPPIGTQEDENEIYREAAQRAMYDGNGNLKLFGTKLYNLKGKIVSFHFLFLWGRGSYDHDSAKPILLIYMSWRYANNELHYEYNLIS